MNFSERIKQLRLDKGVTQVQLAAGLGISTGTVAMWETGKRMPSFETLCALEEYFDKRMDYLLGRSEDASSPKMTDEELEQLGAWEVEEHFSEITLAYLRLDEHGKNAVESLIRAETRRCLAQESLFPEDGFSLTIKIKRKECDK
jgi:transcriptional regulator with XRE-family HTH domain